jgi:hypothetical protein
MGRRHLSVPAPVFPQERPEDPHHQRPREQQGKDRENYPTHNRDAGEQERPEQGRDEEPDVERDSTWAHVGNLYRLIRVEGVVGV